MISAAFLSLLYAVFAYRHLAFGLAHPSQWCLVAPILVQETSFMVLFAIRRNAMPVRCKVQWQQHVLAYIAGLIGAFGPLLLRIETQPGTIGVVGGVLQVIGLCISTAGLWSLGRSVGIVAANRGVIADRAYRYIRHPMYAGHLVTLLGYALASPTFWNLQLAWIIAVMQVCRIDAEEWWLLNSEAFPSWYLLYSERVPWRLIPGVW